MKKISRVINLFPCATLDDFPTHYKGEDAASLLANWTAAWHPELIAATEVRPVWCSTEQTAPQSINAGDNSTSFDELEDEEFDPYFSDLHSELEEGDTPAANDHNGPHAAPPYNGSPFTLPQHSNASEASMWQRSVLFIPTVSTWSLHDGFAALAASCSAAMIAGHTDRNEIEKRLTGILGLRTDDAIKHWAQEFYALGYAWLQVQLLTRKIRYSSNLNSERFDSALVSSARAVIAEDYDTAELHITTCHDTLMEEKNNYYPVKPDLIDLVLTTSTTLGKSFENEVRSAHATNLQMTGDTMATLAERHPATLNILRKRFAEKSASLLGGNQFELPSPLLSKDSALNQILQSSQTARQLLETEPKVFLRRRAGLTSDLPQLLAQLDFVGALHVSLDRGRVPPSSSGTIAWSGPNENSMMAKTEAPLDASEASTYLDFAVQFGHQLDSVHSATMMLVHWPGKTQSAFGDLVRIAARSPLLGTFQTLEQHFEEVYDPGYSDKFLADEYRPAYLAEACRSGALAPLSTVVTYWNRAWQLTSLAHLNTFVAMANAMHCVVDRGVVDGCSAVAKRINDAQTIIEQETETWQPRASEVDSQINAIQEAVLQLYRSSFAADLADNTASVLINPLGFRRRLATKITNPNSNTEARFSKTQEPFRLCATDGKQAVDYWVMDVDSFGAECVQNNVMAGSSDLKREPDVLNGDKLQNEFFTAIVDSKTGGLRSIQFHGKRGNRGGQRIVFHDEARPNTSSQMICRSLKSTALSKIGGQIETEGAIVIDQVEVAEFRQTFRLFRGQRHLEIEIQLTPKVTLPPSANTWFASQLAWQDEACKLYGACQLAKFEAVDPLILSPNFVEMSMSDYSLTLLAGGLPAHRRTARCRLDTMLVVGNEQQRNFRLALGINISHAARAAINFGSPIYSLDQLPSDKAETNSLARCLLHLDCKNIISTFCEPVFADGKLVAVRLRLQETEGRAGRLQISTPLRLTKVERQDVRGNANLVLEIDADMHRVGLEFSQHDFFQVELTF